MDRVHQIGGQLLCGFLRQAKLKVSNISRVFFGKHAQAELNLGIPLPPPSQKPLRLPWPIPLRRL
jgi:hypothetical protein